MKVFIAAVCLALATAIPQISKYSPDSVVVDGCTCYEKGNYYSPSSANDCGSFWQRTAWLPAEEQNCPPGLKFDIHECVCNWPSAMTCPANCPYYPTPTTAPDYECRENGNIYSPVAGTNCRRFTQATDTLPPVEHTCPAGLMFNIDVCVCDYHWRTTCPN